MIRMACARTAMCVVAAAVLAVAASLRAAEASTDTPNFVVIVADDLGWGDVGFHGSKIKTPNLDRLAREGVELAHHYVATMCSPTRAALLSGRYWSRFGITGAQNQRAYPFGTTTLASALSAAGYDTAITGKWHLGSKLEWGPRKFGFDHSYGSLAGGVGPWNHRYKTGPFTYTWHRDDALVEEEGHVTDLIAAEAARWIESRTDRPFFLYVPFTAVHIPIDEPQEWLDLYPDVEPPTARQFCASGSHMDDCVGRILAALDRAGRRDDTLVVFFSDNGATPGVGNADQAYPGTYPPGPAGGTNEPLRGRKSQVYEGGIRVPALVHWPMRLAPHTVDTPLHVVDWMPTLCALAGHEPPADLKWDGRNMWDVIAGQASPAPRTLYTAGVGFRQAALRHGDWKLVVFREQGGKTRTELYDLGVDPYETTDLAAREPARVAELERLLADHAARDNDAVATD